MNSDTESTVGKRLGSRALFERDWLRMELIEYIDGDGCHRTWEAVNRQGAPGAVQMIPVLRPSGKYVFIEQYRPPVDSLVIEFPAGLIDPGESPESTALRELHEETGYRGEICWMGPRAYSSPGLSSESVIMVMVDIDESLPCNQNPEPCLDEEEQITAITVVPNQIPEFLRRKHDAGVLFDSKVLTFFLGAGMGTELDL